MTLNPDDELERILDASDASLSDEERAEQDRLAELDEWRDSLPLADRKAWDAQRSETFDRLCAEYDRRRMLETFRGARADYIERWGVDPLDEIGEA
jgi:hypothetical protein